VSANVTLDFDALMQMHPSFHDIKSKVDVPSYIDETCAVQLSYGLNRAGGAILHYGYLDTTLYRSHVNAYKSTRDGFNYIFGVPDMKVYLNNTYGVADNYKGSKEEMIAKITGRTGILGLGHRHIDIWQNDHYQWQRLYKDLWHFESVKLRGIFFWEMSPTGDN